MNPVPPKEIKAVEDVVGNSALDGVLVVEIGERRALAACGLLLAQAGATVIVLEPEDAGDLNKWRSRPTLLAGKSSLSLNAEHGDVDRVLQAADVVLLSSDQDRPILSAVAKKLSSDEIVCEITSFGSQAPAQRGWPEKIIQAYSGVAEVTGLSDAPPTLSDVPVLEFHAGIYAAAGVLAALRVRDRDGVVQRLDVSIYECGINSLATFLPLHYGYRNTQRAENRHQMLAPWNAYHAKDGWVLLRSAKDEHWMKLCDLMERPELAREGPFVKLADRLDRVDEVDAVVNGWTGSQSVEECIRSFSEGGVASGPIISVTRFETDASIVYRRMVRRLHDPATQRSALIAGTPLKASRTPGVESEAAPLRGNADADQFGTRCKTPLRQSSIPRAPCEGLLVMEIGQYTTVPLAARHLSSLGAEVRKIEPLAGEESRAWSPHQTGTGYFFAMSNSGKRSVSLNLGNPADKELFTALVRKADVLVENMKPGSLAKLGFPPSRLDELNPRLIYCGISGFGADSRHPGRPAFDTVVQAMSGLMDLTRVEGTPVELGISAGDITGGIFALYAVLTMIAERERSGRGQSIDLAMQDATVWLTQTSWNGEEQDTCTIFSVFDGYIAAAARHHDVEVVLANVGHLDRANASMRLRAAGILAVPVRSVARGGGRPGNLPVRRARASNERWGGMAVVQLPDTAFRNDPCGIGADRRAIGEGRARAEEIAVGVASPARHNREEKIRG